MVGRPHDLKYRELTRYFKAMEAAGVPDPVVTITRSDGTVITLGRRDVQRGEGTSAAADQEPASTDRTVNPWDEVLSRERGDAGS